MISKKILLLGEIGVGKTSLVRRLVLDEFSHDYRPTIGVDIYRYPLDGLGPTADRSLELVIWDIDGHYGESIFRHVYSRGSSGALIVGDLTRAPTISYMCELARGYSETMPGRYSANVLNKSDLVRPADVTLPAVLMADDNPPVFTSALTGERVRETFRAAAEAILRRET